jgi:ribonuclease E
MTKRMLIDATHAEETRVVVLDGNRLEDFDVETQNRKQLKGNIYLAKIVRVEPSLQAAFVEYGGNRHGFLAFSEIHPDYYQIPVADRQRLIAMQEEEARADAEAEEAEDDRRASASHGHGHGHDENDASGADDEGNGGDADMFVPAEPGLLESGFQTNTADDNDAPDNGGLPLSPEMLTEPDFASAAAGQDPEQEEDIFAADAATAQPLDIDLADSSGTVYGGGADQSDATLDHNADRADRDNETGHRVHDVPGHEDMQPPPETVGGNSEHHDDGHGRERRSPPRFLRNYKIQEVIRRRQILLIQVVKEERGNKGAALTTYISLAGRYSVLMPNSPRGGGISRKITSATDRRRLKEITAELEIPRGMGLIVRTAGANRPKPEIKRDCEYLLRMWDEIRELTLRSVSPALIYEEASLIKRAIRDVYSRDVDDLIVDGEEGWKAARDFMRMLMPTHVKKVQLWRGDGQKLFAKYQIETQLDAMYTPTVQLRSGGYLVINQTEALVAVDVNSGRSTRERNIEETALRTNMEAAEEVARQLRLRDLAGLIVIDFIDMELKKNNAAVERRMKESLKNDRARIQVGHISHFGLMEMSRQRLRPSIAESSSNACPHCGGTGHVRSTESAALHVLRAIEDEGGKRRAAEILVHVNPAIALYILNHKRDLLAAIENRFGMRVGFAADDALLADQSRVERLRAAVPPEPSQAVTHERSTAYVESTAAEENEEEVEETDAESDEAADAEAVEGESEGESEERRRRRRRRRRRGGRRDDQAELPPELSDQPDIPESAFPVLAAGQVAVPATRPADADGEEAGEGESESRDRNRRRRGRGRGRERGPRHDDAAESLTENKAAAAENDLPVVAAETAPPAPRAPANLAYAGPTPADPFAKGVLDIFEILEQSEALAAEAALAPAPAIVPIRAAAPPEKPSEPVVGPAILPIPVEDAAREPKRGWWRR